MADVVLIEQLIASPAATCLVGTAMLKPVGEVQRFQAAGFPEIGQVTYQRPESDGKKTPVCIVDSAASMANHLESVCAVDGGGTALHEDLRGLAHVACATTVGADEHVVCTTLTEGHRLASDYFVGSKVRKGEELFREVLQREMRVRKLAGKEQPDKKASAKRKSDKKEASEKYFYYPDGWGAIYSTIFKYDPNSLVHGILFAKEQIKIARFLTAHHEAEKVTQVSTTGVKFDKLGKTVSGQPIFAVTQQTALATKATFILDLALLRSYGQGAEGLTAAQKRLVLELALWKIQRLVARPFRFRSGCYLELAPEGLTWKLDGALVELAGMDIRGAIATAGAVEGLSPTKVYYPADELFRVGKDAEANDTEEPEEEEEA